MKVTVLGSGSPVPSRGLAQSGFLLESNDQRFLVDCGSGVLLRLSQRGIDLRQLDAVLITHFHWDHMGDLPSLLVARWLLGQTETQLFGPRGAGVLVPRLLEVLPYVREHVRVQVAELDSGQVITVGNAKVECRATQHLVPTLAYKFDGKVVICGDSEPLSELASFAAGAKLLFHECSFPDGVAATGHSTPTALGAILAKSGVQTLVLTHLYPEARARQQEIKERIGQHFEGEVLVAEDLMALAA